MDLYALMAFLKGGGFTSQLIIAAGLALIGLSVERIWVLYFYLSAESGRSQEDIRELILQRKYRQAIQICNNSPQNLEMQVIRSGLLAIDNGREAMKSALSSALVNISQKCETRLSFIALIASSATLLGLLGTISGLISTFAGLAAADSSEKARLLGSGIAEAMNATAAGLIIGLAAMAVHTLCISKSDDLTAKAQSAGLNLSNWVEEAEREKLHG